MDPCVPPSEPVLDMDSLVLVVEQQSNHSELSDNVQEILLKAQCNAGYKETLDCISSHNSRPQNVSKHKLRPDQECLLWGWFQPEQNTVW